MVFWYGFLLVFIWFCLRVLLHALGIRLIKFDWLCFAASWLFDKVKARLNSIDWFRRIFHRK